jgi:hypothetical protein
MKWHGTPLLVTGLLFYSAVAQNMARRVVENFSMAEHAVSFGLRLGHAVQSVLGAGAMAGITRAIRALPF